MSPSTPDLARFAALKQALTDAGFRGTASLDLASRAAMSTDNSVYECAPDLVVAPRDEEDTAVLLKVMAAPSFRDIAITGRGGGTGTNGQSLSRGVIVNFQRFMTRILAVNIEEGWAEVEPGLVLDELNTGLAGTGLFFAPNTSTANRCTIGGMVGTDASGKGSRIYGKTSDNILALSVVLEGGNILSSRDDAPDWAVPLIAELASACDAGRAALMARTPRLNRRFTGYDLERARPSRHRLDWWRLLLGAEGTLGLVTRIRVKLVPVPAHKRLVVVAFKSFRQALLACDRLLTHEPLAIEVMDEWVQRLAREAGLTDALPENVRGQDGQSLCHVFVEFIGDDAAALDTRIDAFSLVVAHLEGVAASYVSSSAAEQKTLWSVRAAAVGLLSQRRGHRRPIAFIEDSVVPVENLAPFVADFDALMRAHGLTYGIYGHIDVGCLHVRPALDLDEDVDRRIFKTLSDAVYALCTSHGGIFWGEHGKGVRGVYLPDFVGPQAYTALQRVKRAFDPLERFNPGKLIVIDRPRLGILDLPFRRGNAPTDPYEKSFHCNGNAACLSFAHTTPMCPSYQVTRDNRQSPKGRADALRDWRQAQLAGRTDLRARQEDVFESLRTCLGCNACASRCPVRVGIPEMKSFFLETYYRTRRRPWRDYALGALEASVGPVDRARPLARLAMQVAGPAIQALLGLCDAPTPSRRGLRQLGPPVLGWRDARRAALAEGDVLVLVDPFTAMFDTDAIAAVCEGLAALTYRAHIVTLPAGAKAPHILGMRQLFERRARQQIAALRTLAETRAALVAVDPAFAFLICQDYRRLDTRTPRISLVQEFLYERLQAGDRWPSLSGGATPKLMPKLMAHCTERAALPNALHMWQDIFGALGIAVEAVETGCCGMSGIFGHEARNQNLARALFDASWAPAVAGQKEVLATGFSCRCQVERFSTARACHPMALIAQRVDRA